MTDEEIKTWMTDLADQGLITIAPGALDGPVRGVVCGDCQQHMLEAAGCVPSGFYFVGGETSAHKEWTPRIPYENDIPDNERETHRCHDCGCKLGAIHHFGCDMEVCPSCNGQAAFCGCVGGVILNPDTVNEVVYFVGGDDEEAGDEYQEDEEY